MINGLKGRLPHRYNSRSIVLILLAIALFLLLSDIIVHTLTESWWYSALGFSSVFWTLFTWGSITWLGTFLLYSLCLWGNYQLAMYRTRHLSFRLLQGTDFDTYLRILPKYISVLVILLIAFLAANVTLPLWEVLLKAFSATEFNAIDPVFQRDISFYIFQLPLYEAIHEWLLALILCCLGLSVTVYVLKGAIDWQTRRWEYMVDKFAKIHLTLLLVAIAFLSAYGFWLERYQLLYSTEGIVYGAGYTDANARAIAYTIMVVLSIALGLWFLLSATRKSLILPSFGLGLYLIALTLITGLYPWFIQQFIVEPTELARETPYIQQNISFTRQAYNIEKVQVQEFPAEASLTLADLAENQPTLDNIRLWDNRPLLTTYRQLQEIRLYYRFNDVDIDRYYLGEDYREVMLSARELSFAEVPPRAQTWVNQRLKYTHGYGLVMSPVNEATPQGLPVFFIQNVPPNTIPPLDIVQPRIYYGEETEHYIFTGTETDEFDYPLGDENASNFYDGEGGVTMGSVGRRLAYAYDLNSLKILISAYFKSDSKIHYYRDIKQRVQKIAPYLRLDDDPYISLINGRLKWFIDAYTTSKYYPYSEPVSEINNTLQQYQVKPVLDADFNYIRNAVKIVVDAYDGTIDFYVVDETDPILSTYRKIFPNVYKPSSSIPPEVYAHFRYPVNLFKIQSQVYLAYHMEAPEVFYNQEDLWRFPVEIYEQQEQLVEPYYLIMRLPGWEEVEFVLSLPFTPINRDNMIAWMAARSDGDDYGELILYEFPKQELVFGPAQIEARIDQDPIISEQLTLWDQQGSRVIRGDLLVIPIDTSILYVEPIYLRAERGELPELTRVIVSYDDRIVMEESLEEALAAVFRGDTGLDATPILTGSALQLYEDLQEAARVGDWAEYGRLNQELVDILDQLEGSAEQ